jgi:hypothetical protein
MIGMTDVNFLIRANLNGEGIHDEVIILAVQAFYQRHDTFNKELLKSELVWRGEYDFAVRALTNGTYRVYEDNGAKIYGDDESVPEPESVKVTGFNSVDKAYEWASIQLNMSGQLLFKDANPMLGCYKQDVYKRLATDGLANMAPDGLVLKEVDSPVAEMQFSRQCPMCGKHKLQTDFMPGRSMCKTCYNESRRSSEEIQINNSVDLKRTIKDFNVAQKKLMRTFEEDMRQLMRNFKDDIEELMDNE